ncbi:MAG: hypothetical protein EOM22_11170 [Gammaproteobacteria bacterium]|nr:hypothetical protein [Gammaproteobacteria bacterium]
MTISADDEARLNKMTPGAYRANLGTRLGEAIAAIERTYLKNAFLLTAPTLMIKAEGSKLVKSGAEFSVLVAGTKVTKAANTDMPVPLGTLATAKFAAWAFDLPATGTIAVTTKTADVDTYDAAVAALPALADNHVRLGYIVIENTSGDNFVGDTTVLDAAGIAVTYVNAEAEPAFAG